MQYVIIIYAWKILPEMREDNANKRILSSVGTVNKMRGRVCSVLSILSILKQDKPQNEVDETAFNILDSATVFPSLRLGL